MSSTVPETAIQRIAQLAGQCAFDWDAIAKKMQLEASYVQNQVLLSDELDAALLQFIWDESLKLYR